MHCPIEDGRALARTKTMNPSAPVYSLAVEHGPAQRITTLVAMTTQATRYTRAVYQRHYSPDTQYAASIVGRGRFVTVAMSLAGGWVPANRSISNKHIYITIELITVYNKYAFFTPTCLFPIFPAGLPRCSELFDVNQAIPYKHPAIVG